ncbi:hypothetical protein BDQ94DRAFT_173399 [Aspergillus welwitschiae]|uniref:Uncharacterized protein n=1 Tax=Aspergillus welwitschiae TaxID=1341132 RepID=A0A3F3PSU5_9EURO|nr:hypothetical protein BDQ94DRAFT_173399 [Aspergillus welwitschiae]RDH29908.1 hypothetical protein BDQ94DRAFT_173399 [Aspergillus welwitschiae]
MTAILSNILDRSLARSHRKKVDSYLRDVTTESVLQGLSNTIVIRDRATAISPQAIFDASCIRDTPQEKPYWTRVSLENHLAKTHSEITFPDRAIDVLWSSFYFYAYHPFPRPDVDQGKLEFSAFERAVAILALQGDKRLGSVENGFGNHWRPDRSYTRELHQHRILRSICRISGSKLTTNDPHMLEDVVDVLFTTHPYSMKYPTDPATLTPVAERLLRGKVPNHQLMAEDLSALLSLFIRLRQHELTWNRGIQYGFFEEASSVTEDLSRTLVQSSHDEPPDMLHPEAALRVSKALSNLEWKFHELWATISQPPMLRSSPVLGPTSEDTGEYPSNSIIIHPGI